MLAAMAWPEDIEKTARFLRKKGIVALVTLNEHGVDERALRAEDIQWRHVPIPDFSPPTQEQIERFVEIVDEARERGGAVAVHCTAGRGRTGTMLACFLVSRGYSARRAIERVRELRPGSIETTEQEEAVCEYAQRAT